MVGRSGWRRLAVAAVLGMIAVRAPTARAAGKGGRVGVVVMRGAGEGPVRAKVSNAIKASGFQIVGGQQLDSTASSLGVALDSDAGFKAVAKELNISAFVSGEIGRKKADLTVRNGADGTVLGDASFPGANPKKIADKVGSDFWRELGPAVRLGKPPSGAKTKAAIAEEAAPAEEAAASEPPPPAEPRSEGKKKGKRIEKRAEQESAEAAPAKSEEGEPEGNVSKRASAAKEEAEEPAAARSAAVVGPALAVGVGGRALFRRLNWHQTPMNNLPPYALSPGPEGTLWLETYPGAFVSRGFITNIGVFASYDQGFGVTSTTTDGARLTTKFQDLLVGAKVRLPVNELLTPYLSAAFATQGFKLQSSTGAASVVPSVAYKSVRLGLGTRLAFTPVLAADVGVGFLLLTDLGKATGEIAAPLAFPNGVGKGIDVGASVSYRIIKHVGARVGVDFRQYGLDFKVRQGDPSPLVAGGATDRYITVWGGVEVVLDGLAGGAGADDDDEKEPEPAAPPASKKKKAASEDSEEEAK